jgi:hypothetical protein
MSVRKVAEQFGMRYATAKHFIKQFRAQFENADLAAIAPPYPDISAYGPMGNVLPGCGPLLLAEASDDLYFRRLKRARGMVRKMEAVSDKIAKQIRKKWPRRNDFIVRILKKPQICAVNEEASSPMSFHFVDENTS